jgi:membrane associated rhomboid family serine protease
MQSTETPVALSIILLNIVLTVYVWYSKKDIFPQLALHPYSIVHYNRWYMMLTSGFVHANLMHLAFNMLTLYFFAISIPLENILGRLKFVLIYFISLIISNISTIIKNRNNPNYFAVGASGAISGVLFSFIIYDIFVLGSKAKLGIILLPIPMPSWIFGILYLIYCILASKYSKDLINHEAHFWGAISGIILTLVLKPEIIF